MLLKRRVDAAPLAPPPAAGTSVDGEEARLIGRVAAGELAAFDALYRAYHPRLTRFVERMTRRPALVEEVLNDTLLVVWRRAASFDGTSKVSTWIFGIAYRRSLKALQRLDEPVADDAAAERVDGRPGPEQRLGESERQAALQRTLDRLSPAHRAVVDLTYFHGLDYREIAEVAGCPVDTVKTRMFHARRRLKVLLPGSREDWL